MGWPTRTAFLLAPSGAIALGSILLASLAQAAEKCTLGKVAELPIAMAGTRPLITAKINGQEARFTLDSGAFFSMMSAATAAEFNLKLKMAPYGLRVQGIGGSVSPDVATVKEFGIAGAVVHNVEFLVGGGEIGSQGLIGQNFLEQWDVEYDFAKGVVRLFKPEGCNKYRLAYWITPGQTYSEMQIESVAHARLHTAQTGEPAKDEAPGDHQAGAAADEHADPDELERRGEASAARHGLEHALADLSKAVELRPDNPEYLYQRAMVYRQSGQSNLALTDLDQVLTLNQDFLRAYIPRAEIRLHERNVDGAIADLDAVDRLAPKQSDLRFVLAERYEAANRFSRAIAQYDLWIQNHPDDSKRAIALAARCRASAIENEDLAGGLTDCNAALRISDKRNPNYGHLFTNRGLLELRQAYYDKAIADFDAALKTIPKDAYALYGRGVAKIRKNRATEGEADMAEAVKIEPSIAAPFKARGLAP